MKRVNWAVALVGAVLTFSSAAWADVTVVKTEDGELRLGAMSQVGGVAQSLDDQFADDQRVYLFMKTARLRMFGEYHGVGLNMELGLGPEDKILAPSPGIALGLLDLNFDVPLLKAGDTYVRVGQSKVPYGREQLTYSGQMMFADRSIQHLGSVVGRDVGVSVVSTPGPFKLIGGVYTGGGRNVPWGKMLPQNLGVPLLVARLGVGNIDENPFYLTQSSRGVDKAQWGFYVNGLFTRDSLVGHSGVLAVKTTDKSLVLNGNWNPYIGGRPLDQGKYYQTGFDAVVRAPVGGLTVGGEVQVDYTAYENRYGHVHTTGGRALGTVARGNLELGLRYAMLISSPNFAVADKPITGKATLHEVAPSVSYYLFGDNVKLIADLPVLLNAPVVTEDKVGAYVVTDIPDQTSLLAKNGTIAPQTVVQGRLLFQAQF